MNTLDQAFAKAYEQPAPTVIGPTYGPPPAIPAQPLAKPAESSSADSFAPTAAQPLASVSDEASKARPARARSSRAHKGAMPGSARPAVARSASPPRSGPRPSREKSAGHAARSQGGNPPKVGGFRPLLEVDGFLWPKQVARLAAPSHEAMEELVTSLLERVGRDQKVIGWQACRHGDGCSTLLLAVARRLAERGLKVALVDADFQHPSLARRLGLTPTSGWEGVLAGHVSLPEVVVESLREGIGLAPCCVPGAEDPACDATPTDPASALDTLRRGYDVVLVDLGRGQSGGGCADLLPSLRSQLDLTVVVHNVGEVPLTELRQVCRTLSRTGTAALAVVENFV